MKLSNITVLASCATLVLSQPLEKRVLVVETVYEQVVETVELTTTFWVKPGEHLPSASVTPKVDVVVTDKESPSTSVVSTPKYTASFRSKQKHKHTSKKRSATPTPPAIESPPPVIESPPPVIESPPPAIETPPPASETPPPAVETPPPAVETPPPAVETPPPAIETPPPVATPEATSAPPVQAPPPASPQEQFEYSFSFDPQTEQPTPTVIPEPTPIYSYSIDPQTEAPTPAVTLSPKSNVAPSSSGGACGTIGGECSGDLTFYEAGLGACGWPNNGETDDVFALAHEMMGTQSNGNPYCGRSATVYVDDKSVVVKLVDKCMGCSGQSIDLSNHAIDQLMDRGVGRKFNVKWHFND